MAGQLGLLGEIGAVLNGLSGVFSTVQWGGRAYKVPLPGKSTRGRGKLLAFVSTEDGTPGVRVSFKLKPPRAREVVDRYDWIESHRFRTLAPSGWVTARVRTKRQLAALTGLLKESRELYGTAEPAEAEAPRDGAAERLDRVMSDLRAGGWSPRNDW